MAADNLIFRNLLLQNPLILRKRARKNKIEKMRFFKRGQLSVWHFRKQHAS